MFVPVGSESAMLESSSDTKGGQYVGGLWYRPRSEVYSLESPVARHPLHTQAPEMDSLLATAIAPQLICK